MRRVDRSRTWIVLHDGMPDHPKIECLGDKAFRALITLWCWSGRQQTDGRVPKAIWEKRATPAVRRELIAAKLVDPTDAGDVVMHDYLDWQRSAADIEKASAKKRDAAMRGNHERWHVREGRFDPECDLCNDPNSSPEGSQQGSQMRSDLPRKTVAQDRTGQEKVVALGGERPESNAHGAVTPRPRCPKHAELPSDQHIPACTACKRLRLDAQRQAAEQAKRDADSHAQRRAATAACHHCDADGWRVDPRNRHRGPLQPGVRCDHTPWTDEQLDTAS